MAAGFEVHIAPNTLFEIVPGVPVTDSIVTMWIVMGILIVLAVILRLRLQTQPKGFQNLAEWALGGLHDFMKEVGGESAQKHFPIFVTFFLTILFSNWFGLIVGKVGEELGFLRAPTSDLNSAAALALVAFFYFEYQGMKAHGVFGHLGHFVNIKALFRGGTGIIDFFVGLLHIISELVRPTALTLRLFGNIFGGEIVLAVAFSILPAVFPLPFMILEFIVGLIQAFVFAVLFLTFTSLNSAHEEEDHKVIAPTKDESGPPVQVLVG